MRGLILISISRMVPHHNIIIGSKHVMRWWQFGGEFAKKWAGCAKLCKLSHMFPF